MACRPAAALPLLLLAPAAAAAAPECFYLPVGTHPHGHFLCTPAAPARGELLLFFGGSGSHPSNQQFRAFLAHAQGLGFHIFSVAYPDAPSMGSTCGGQAPGCFLQERMARLYGGKRWNGSAIAPEDGGVVRFASALRRLPAQRPAAEGWSAFIDAAQNVRWGKVVSAGHSQGAGMAPLLAKNQTLAAVVQLSGVDDVFHPGHPVDPKQPDPAAEPAQWIRAPGATPAARFFGLGHRRGFACYTWTINWPALNMTGWSDAGDAAPRGQMLCGTADSQYNYHGCTVSDTQFAPAWTYMLLRGGGGSVGAGAGACDCANDTAPSA